MSTLIISVRAWSYKTATQEVNNIVTLTGTNMAELFWTRIINETDNPLELTIDFSGDRYEFPGSEGASVSSYYKIMLHPDTMRTDKEGLYNYGLTDLKSFLVGI